MTIQDYNARLRLWGLTPSRPSVNRHTIHQTRDGQIIRVPDPEHLTDEERASMLELLRTRYGLTDYH